MNICVVGLGKIGLPLAVQYASKGHSVIGADINHATVELVNAGCEPFPGEADLQEKLSAAVGAGLLTATTDTAQAVSQSDVVVIVVPLFVDADSQPDFGWMDAATSAVGAGLRAGTLVSYETTLPVGSTRERFGPMIAAQSGLEPGRDFHLVFSPERVLTGRVFADLRRYPKLVGGIDEASERRGADFYEAVLDFEDRSDLPRPNGVWRMGSAEAAEMAKLAETTYRDVNIGLANQFARFADRAGIDVYAVIEACNSQPFSHIHQPGIAVGGHCIPVYPKLFLSNYPEASVVRTSRQVNESMADYCLDQIEEILGTIANQHVAILGAAYRGGVKETAFSGVFALHRGLALRGARVLVHDPLYTEDELRNFNWSPYKFGISVDVAIIQTDHQIYAELSADDLPGVKLIYDGRNVLSKTKGLPFKVVQLGRPSQNET